MKKLFAFLFLAMVFVASVPLSAQVRLDSIIGKFNHYRENNFQEKVYVQSDRYFYLTGETLWFKTYLVDGSFHKPVSVSKIIYLELLDKNNKAMLQTKVHLDSRGGNGALFLPATLSSGTYTLRAYTNWMKNFSPEFFFHKTITIVNPFVKPELDQVTVKQNDVVLEFFPEGGHLVAGLESKVGFRMMDTQGKSVSLKGAILSSSNDTLVTFKPLMNGIGNFVFVPGTGQSYRCITLDTNEKVTTHKLPTVSEQGYAMQLRKDGDNIMVRVLIKSGSSAPSFTYLLVHSRGRIIRAEARNNNGEALFQLERKTLPAGISHFTVFNEAMKPVCERLYFSAPETILDVKVAVDQPSYMPRKKVSVSLNAMTGQVPAKANLAVSVYRTDSLVNTNSGIASYLLLTSDLKGNIESPEYYLSSKSPEVEEARDNLMLTHGWRRFSWDYVFSKQFSFEYMPEYRNHLITGSVTKSDGTPAVGILTYLSSPGKLVNLFGSRSNEDGHVYFEVNDFTGYRKLVLQTNVTKDSVYNLAVNSPYSEQFGSRKPDAFVLSENFKNELQGRSIAMQVQDIYYREESERIHAVKNDSSAFFGYADETYYLDTYTRFPVLEEVMREYVPGVLVRKRRDGFHFIVINRIQKGVLEDPMVLLDGVPVFDVDKIMGFDPLKIKKLEVVTRNFYTGPLALPGIVSYSTYNGDLGGFELDPRDVSINYEGLQLQREYYSPKYDTPKQRNSRLPDQRILLSWIPDLMTGEDGKQSIEFYTSDVEGSFIIEVEGITSDGLPGSGTASFTVSRPDF